MKSSGWIEICPLKVYKRTRAVTENRSSNWIFFLIAKHVTLAQACKTIQYMKRQGHKSLLAHSLANRIYVILTIAFNISRFKTGQLLIQNNQSIVKKKKYFSEYETNWICQMKGLLYQAQWKASQNGTARNLAVQYFPLVFYTDHTETDEFKVSFQTYSNVDRWFGNVGITAHANILQDYLIC